MRVGVLELLVSGPPHSLPERIFQRVLARHFASVAPQAVSAWCRRLGHDVRYATWYGQADPLSLLPPDLDALLLSCHSHSSPLAYALARIYRGRGALTVIGGPHARSFPADCLRFFDVAVRDCDQTVLERLLSGEVAPGSFVSARRPPADLPLVEERLPEIRTASFTEGRPGLFSVVPLLASLGCPYDCDFCVDWDSAYAPRPRESLRTELDYMAATLPGVRMAFHDPNFAVRFDEVMDQISAAPPDRRNPYVMQSTLSILREDRAARLARTNCVYIAPSIESWHDYGDKAGTGRAGGAEKVDALIGQLDALSRHVRGIQVNLICGLDSEREEDVELTRAFIRRAPFVLTTLTVASAYGGTPLYDRLRRQGRLLERMPLCLYYMPHLAFVPASGSEALYDRMISLHETMTSAALASARLSRRLGTALSLLHGLRTVQMRATLRRLRRIRRALSADRSLRRFHETAARSPLPAIYRAEVEARLGPYSSLISPADREPLHGQVPVQFLN